MPEVFNFQEISCACKSANHSFGTKIDFVPCVYLNFIL